MDGRTEIKYPTNPTMKNKNVNSCCKNKTIKNIPTPTTITDKTVDKTVKNVSLIINKFRCQGGSRTHNEQPSSTEGLGTVPHYTPDKQRLFNFLLPAPRNCI